MRCVTGRGRGWRSAWDCFSGEEIVNATGEARGRDLLANVIKSSIKVDGAVSIYHSISLAAGTRSVGIQRGDQIDINEFFTTARAHRRTSSA